MYQQIKSYLSNVSTDLSAKLDVLSDMLMLTENQGTVQYVHQ